MSDCRHVHAHLSEWVDGDLPEALRALVETHVDQCAACRGLADDLARIRDAAGRLGPIAPPDHVFLETAGQLHMEQPPREETRAVPSARRATVQWVAIAATLVLVTVGLWTIARPGAPGTATGTSAAHPADLVAAELELAVQHYERAIQTLESMAAADQLPIEPGTTVTLRASLDAVDEAIAESRQALDATPDSQPARESLFDALRQKVGLLQATVQLLNDVRPDGSEPAPAAGRSGRSS
ncbi:MAG TPA: zf-HC2 domain-containing protein [Vicinamibacterales bacterium]|nr:zf-HC2 domain-containing protein [Vicinamibacterales bacterium]